MLEVNFTFDLITIKSKINWDTKQRKNLDPNAGLNIILKKIDKSMTKIMWQGNFKHLNVANSSQTFENQKP